MNNNSNKNNTNNLNEISEISEVQCFNECFVSAERESEREGWAIAHTTALKLLQMLSHPFFFVELS